MRPTTEQITALAPDPASAKAGRGLMNPGKWPTLGASEDALWGECQGSGKDPYQVSVDLAAIAAKCTCPSRKFPCKHGLALLYLAAEKPASLTTGEPPGWTAEWLASRREKAEKKAAIAAAPPEEKKAPDPEAAAKRAAKRLARMQEGGAELGRWVADQVRSGIAVLPQQSASTFRTVSARMVDAQTPGLAVEITRLERQLRTGPDWPRRTLGQLGRMHSLAEGLGRYEELPAPLQGDLRASLGWAMDREELIASQAPVVDTWCVLGQSFTERERLWERRTWLVGRRSTSTALILDFSHGSRNFPLPLLPGTEVETAVIFYPSAAPLRAILLEPPQRAERSQQPFPASTSIRTALERVTDALAANPWLHQAPLALAEVTPYRTAAETWALRDAEGTPLPLQMAEPDAWSLLANSGGRPLRVFGIWETGALHVHSAWGTHFHPFTGTSYDE